MKWCFLLTVFFSFHNLTYAQDSIGRKEFNDFKLEISNTNSEINRNLKGLKKLNPRVDSLEESVAEQTEAILRHETLLPQIDTNKQKVDSISTNVQALENGIKDLSKGVIKENRDYLNQFWVLLAAVLVFFMQAGFKVLETGLVRKEHNDAVGIKNLIDWLVLSLVFFGFGFGFMYGESNGIIGWSLFFPTHDDMAMANSSYSLEFFLYQLAFAATSATIVSGAISERMKLLSYILLVIGIGLVIYPFIGHSVWGETYLDGNVGKPFLAKMGFMDFAGSTVVHSVGAWVALVGCILLKERRKLFEGQRFLPKDTLAGWSKNPFNYFKAPRNLNNNDFAPNSLGYSILGVFLLWFGWWGFNGGSTLGYDYRVARIILNTNVAGASAGLMALALAMHFDRTNAISKTIGGTLGGLVAITACCQMVDSREAIFIGILAGYLHNLGWNLLANLRIDDAVGAIPVHGICGIWGTLCVGLFGDPLLFSKNQNVVVSKLDDFAKENALNIAGIEPEVSAITKAIADKMGSTTPDQVLKLVGDQLQLPHDQWSQVGVQFLGIILVLVVTIFAALLILFLISLFTGIYLGSDWKAIQSFAPLRIDRLDEEDGDILEIRRWLMRKNNKEEKSS